MGGVELGIRLLAGVVLVLGNAFFVASEFALTRLRQYAAGQVKERPDLELAWKMTEEMEIYLTGCQVGISLCSILLGVVVEPAVTALLTLLGAGLGLPLGGSPAISVVIAVVAINLVHKVWGEQAPTYLGVERPLDVVRICAPILYGWTMLTYPLVMLGDGAAKWTLARFGVSLTRSWTEGPPSEEEDGDRPLGYGELRHRLVALLARGPMSTERQQEVAAALDIDQLTVREIMVPADQVAALRLDASADQQLALLADASYVRYPLIGRDLDDCRGIVYLPVLFHHLEAFRAGELDLSTVAAEPLTVRADLPVSQLVDHLQRQRQEAALVRDAEGGIIGLVTATDAFEAVLGNLEDPLDDPPDPGES